MGLFSFVKNAGAKLFGKNKQDEKQEQSPEKKSEALAKHILSFGLNADNVSVDVEGEKAILSGSTDTTETKNKVLVAVGNVEGISEVEDNISVDSPEPEARYYTVKKGDYLSKISKEVYGSANKYNIIFEANKPMLTHPDKIYPGQVLIIPSID